MSGSSWSSGPRLSATLTLGGRGGSSIYDLNGRPVTIEFNLDDGEHYFEAEAQCIGTLRGFPSRKLEVRVRVYYAFSATHRAVTLYSPESGAARRTTLVVSIGGVDALVANGNAPLQRASEHDWAVVPAELLGQFRAAAGSVLSQLREHAREQGFNIFVQTPPPELTESELLPCLAVYRDGEFLEPFDPTKTYGATDEVRSVLSVWWGEVLLNPREVFANVIGSTDDPKVAGLSWLQLWQKHFRPAIDCTSRDYEGFPCNGGLVGGHVVLGQIARRVPAGADYVFIMPICTAHNNNDNVTMAALMYREGVALHRYLER